LSDVAAEDVSNENEMPMNPSMAVTDLYRRKHKTDSKFEKLSNLSPFNNVLYYVPGKYVNLSYCPVLLIPSCFENIQHLEKNFHEVMIG
jgi:hypothetical protein